MRAADREVKERRRMRKKAKSSYSLIISQLQTGFILHCSLAQVNSCEEDRTEDREGEKKREERESEKQGGKEGILHFTHLKCRC